MHRITIVSSAHQHIVRCRVRVRVRRVRVRARERVHVRVRLRECTCMCMYLRVCMFEFLKDGRRLVSRRVVFNVQSALLCNPCLS